MSRTARASVGGVCYHVLNRGNGRAEVFHKAEDYRRFTQMIHEACDRLPMRVTGWCLIPNHFHLVLWPYNDGDLSRWMQWLMTCHVRRYHRHYHSDGHIWQGRFKAFPIQQDAHYLTVLRYVERNPLRAKLISRAQDWCWSSLRTLKEPTEFPFLSDGPVRRPRNWLQLVNREQPQAQLQSIRHCIQRGAPLGEPAWIKRTAARLGLTSTINPRGRPPKESKK